MMLVTRRVLRGVVGAGVVAGAVLVGLAPSAVAAPPNCTAADLAGVSAGVSAATSAYLFTHPDVNAFFTGLEGAPRDTLRDQIQQYLDANPQVKDELAGIRQPLVDLKARCGGARRSRPTKASRRDSARRSSPRIAGRCRVPCTGRNHPRHGRAPYGQGPYRCRW